MIREEEDDLTQEMRALVVAQAEMLVRERYGRIINKIGRAHV